MIHPTDALLVAPAALVAAREVMAWWLMPPGSTVSERARYWSPACWWVPWAYCAVAAGLAAHFFGDPWRWRP